MSTHNRLVRTLARDAQGVSLIQTVLLTYEGPIPLRQRERFFKWMVLNGPVALKRAGELARDNLPSVFEAQSANHLLPP